MSDPPAPPSQLPAATPASSGHLPATNSPPEIHHSPTTQTNQIQHSPTLLPHPTQLPTTNPHGSPARSEDGAVDLHYSDSEDDSPVREVRVLKSTGGDVAEDKTRKDARACGPIPRDPGPSNWRERQCGFTSAGARPEIPTYKDVLLRPRTFKPKFPPQSAQGQQVWYTESSFGGKSRDAPSVWSRLGPSSPIDGKLSQSNGGFWLETLKAKAGRRCYRCLAAGHRIADCRDPPRCILCFRFGHKARQCPHPPAPHPQAPSRSAACSSTPHQPPARSAPAFKPPTAAAAATRTTPPPLAAAAPRQAAAAPGSHAAMDYACWTPAAPAQRPAHVSAGVPRSGAIRSAERDLEIYSLVAVQIDASVRLDTRLVSHEAARQLYASSVSKMSTATFLLHFNIQHLRNAAYQMRSFVIGHVTLTLRPWKRQVSANALLSKFNYQVRLCIEGVPPHLRHAEAVAGLFRSSTFIDSADCPVEKPQEEECFRLWLWTSEPDGIATTGTLQAEEPVPPPDEYSPDSMDQEAPRAVFRFGPAETMDYDVLIHVDRVHDYTPTPASSTHRSFDSPISGHPDEELEEEYPVKYPFKWRLGVPDGGHRVLEQRRVSVHDRLGDRNGDRSPPRGGGPAGGANNLGLRQFPPSGRYDVGGPSGQEGGFGTCNYHSGSHYRGRQRSSVQNQYIWKVKRDGRMQPGPNDIVQLGQNDAAPQRTDTLNDPMLHEANIGMAYTPPALKSNNGSAATTDHEGIVQSSEEGNAGQNSSMHEDEEHEAQGQWNAQLNTPGISLTDNSARMASPVSNGPMFPALFDLNEEAPFADLSNGETHVADGERATLQDATERLNTGARELTVRRAILQDATDLLNTGARELPVHRPGTKGLSRFVIPLRKSLLCQPVHKTKTPKPRRQAPEDGQLVAVGKKTAVHGQSTQTIDEQATSFLMKTTGTIVGDEEMSEEAQLRFGSRFVMPLHNDTIGDMRVAFDLPAEGNADKLSPLMAVTDLDDD
ncbi:unnamed protein product [Urochloa decumbens]|uniref:CCHC-type domain-containing protein n=1 Tax=Urochloa decumbens TaxID=240449 RepID=A0ABC9B794_9POAL